MTSLRFNAKPAAKLCAAALALSGACTRENPGFFGQDAEESTGSQVETGTEASGNSEGQSEVGESEVGEVGVSSEVGEGDGDGDGDELDLPLCSEDAVWIRVDIVEDTFVHDWPQQQGACVVDYGDPENPGSGAQYGPGDVPCWELNYGDRDAQWLATSATVRTGYLGRADLEWLTGRGAKVQSAKYELPVVFTELEGEVLFSMAPIRDDNADWDAGEGDAVPAIEGEATHQHRSYPYTWGGSDVYGIVDVSKLIQTQWLAGDAEVTFYLPVDRVQSWLDVDGRRDPGFLVWNDVLAPSSFYLGSLESDKEPAMFVQLCYPD